MSSPSVPEKHAQAIISLMHGKQISSIFLFIIGLVVVATYSQFKISTFTRQIQELQISNHELREEVQKLKNENEKRQAEIDKLSDTDNQMLEAFKAQAEINGVVKNFVKLMADSQRTP